MAVNAKHSAMLEKVADVEAWSLDLSTDWEGQLAVDPHSTVATLRQLYGKTAAKTPAVESLYWAALLRHARSEEEVAEAVLARLEPAAAEPDRLLELGPRERGLVLEHLRKLAERLLESADANRAKRQQAAAEPALLGEMAFEEQGRRREAAALYALAHDQVSGQTPEMRFRRFWLCFKLCHTLFLPEERREREIQPWVALARRTAKAVDASPRGEKIPSGEWRALSLDLYKWLGGRLMALGDHQAAVDAFQQALLNAADNDDKVEAALDLALAWQALDMTQDAYLQVLEVREEADRVKEPALHQRWSLVHKDLEQRLRGDVTAPASTIPEEGGGIPHETPIFKRQLGLARHYAQTGDAARAAAMFADLLPQAQQQPTDLPRFLSYYLETLIETQDPPLVGELVDQLLVSLERLLRRQPTAGARRFVRRSHQQVLEAAVLALTQTAIRASTASDIGQSCLTKVWAVLGAARNVELHWQRQEPVDPNRAARLRQLEAAFHGQRRRALPRDSDRSHWKKALDEVFEYESAESRDLKIPSFDSKEPPLDGVSMAFFEISELYPEPQLLVLGYHQATYHLRLGDADLHRRLVGWRDHCLAAVSETTEAVRDIGKRRPGSSLGKGTDTEPPAITDLLPEALHPLIRRTFESGLESPWSAPTPKPLVPGPWYVFPSGVIHSLLFEMLREPGARSDRFGSGRAIRLCLQSVRLASVPVDFAAGWLGLGGVPELGGIPGLEGALKEINTIASWLRHRGFRKVRRLTGSRAHSRNLEERLIAGRPSVLHLATHGVKDEDYPDACTLILAPARGRPEGDLLPFRRIRQLPADGIELVILSACSSLIGRSDQSAGMEGLAWAFLEAGVKQVIASRYRVEDVATLSFMQNLYKHLLDLSPAEALGRTRDECLQQGMDWRQVGAWSLWS